MWIGMWSVKAVLMKFHMEMRILPGIGLEAIHVTFWERMCLYFAHALKSLWKAKIKQRINLMEKISRQYNI
jgi:hypothetical protein